jgi:aspartate/methionine/tyrosine aminotransferase
VPAVEKVAQNLFICASAPAQQAALACFTAESLAIYEARRREFQARRDDLLPALRDLGFDIPVTPDGAFYIYANVAGFGLPSDQLAHRLLHEAGVCCVPGQDFGHHAPGDWMRISYATSLDNLQEAVRRMRAVLTPLRA